MTVEAEETEMKRRRRRGRPLALLVLAGGVLAGVGSLLPWIELDSAGVAFQGGSVGGSMSGLDAALGRVAFGAAAAVALAALAWLVLERWRGQIATVAAVGSVIIAGIAVLHLIDPEGRFVAYAMQEATSPELSAGKVERLLEALFQNGAIQVAPRLGVILAAAGGGLALIFSYLGLVTRQPASHHRAPQARSVEATARPHREGDAAPQREHPRTGWEAPASPGLARSGVGDHTRPWDLTGAHSLPPPRPSGTDRDPLGTAEITTPKREPHPPHAGEAHGDGVWRPDS